MKPLALSHQYMCFVLFENGHFYWWGDPSWTKMCTQTTPKKLHWRIILKDRLKNLKSNRRVCVCMHVCVNTSVTLHTNVCKFARMENIHLWISKNNNFYVVSRISYFIHLTSQVEKSVSILADLTQNIPVCHCLYVMYLCIHICIS